MQTLLHIRTSPREESISSQVADAYVEAFLNNHSDWDVETFELFRADLPDFRAPSAKAKYAILAGKEPQGEQEDAWSKVMEWTNQFTSADAYVVSSPMWNFSIPYTLKHYIDIIVQPGLTFQFDPGSGYSGLLDNRPITLILARGGAYAEGSGMEMMDFQKVYLQKIFGFIGLTDIHTLVIEPTLAGGPETTQTVLKTAIEQAKALGSKQRTASVGQQSDD